MSARLHKPASWSRLAWFVGLYVAGIAAFALVISGLRALIP